MHPAAFDDYARSEAARDRLQRRTLWLLVLTQIFGGTGLGAGIAVAVLLTRSMLSSDALSGLATALFTLGSAAAALLVGRLSQRSGRRVGLATGFLAGSLGAAGIVVAAVVDSVVMLVLTFIVYGSGIATNLQTRYAGTDLARSNQRARSVSVALVSTTLGAVAGPNLIQPMGRLAEDFGIPPLAGPFVLASAAFGAAALVLTLGLRPDPLLVARAVAAAADNAAGPAAGETIERRGLLVGATVMVLSQLAMVAIMTMTPLHMQHFGHSLADIGLVIGVHIGAMYLPSLITGVLVDKVGRVPMAVASGVTLLAAGTLAGLAPPGSVASLLVALAVLGVGWNFGLISGTALIVDSTPPSVRAKTQGSVDLLIALAGASGGALSGLVLAATSYATLAFAGGVLSLLLVPVVVWSLRRPERPVAP